MRLSLHELIRSDYEARIIGGILAPGDRLPTEQNLMRTYGCSRMTVNKALSKLLAAGLIDRRKKAGTFVAQPKVHSMVLDVPDIAVQIVERGQRYEYRPLRQVLRAPDTNEEEQLLAASGMVMQIDGLHVANGCPLGIEFRLVSTKAVPDIAEVDFQEVSPGSWLLRHVPWTEAESRISAAGASAEEARWLGVTIGFPCLAVERRTWRGSERVTYVKQLFLGNAYEMVARFGPDTPRR